MKNKFLKVALFSSAIIPIGVFIPIITSCSSNTNTPQLFNDSLNNQKYIDVYKFANEGSYDIHKLSKKIVSFFSKNVTPYVIIMSP